MSRPGASAAPLVAAVGAGLLAASVTWALSRERGEPPLDSPQVGEAVEVSLREFAIDMPSELRGGAVCFRVTNVGTLPHSFRLQGAETDAQLTQPLDPGDSSLLQVELRQGEYLATCPLDGHAEQGMRAQLTVVEPHRGR